MKTKTYWFVIDSREKVQELGDYLGGMKTGGLDDYEFWDFEDISNAWQFANILRSLDSDSIVRELISSYKRVEVRYED